MNIAEGARCLYEFGIILRFRVNIIGYAGDIKMYNWVISSPLDHYYHRFLWRNMNTCRGVF